MAPINTDEFNELVSEAHGDMDIKALIQRELSHQCRALNDPDLTRAALD